MWVAAADPRPVTCTMPRPACLPEQWLSLTYATHHSLWLPWILNVHRQLLAPQKNCRSTGPPLYQVRNTRPSFLEGVTGRGCRKSAFNCQYWQVVVAVLTMQVYADIIFSATHVSFNPACADLSQLASP
ncbi:hypothetical protein LIA77_05674 [Sarocladium implicatum]|nr:hypothetical protein LIA77_05674 [Sarocladium implicatum]